MLVGQHYQNGYVCDNIEEAISVFRARGLDRDPQVIPVEQAVQTPDGLKEQQLRICMFWLNGLQYELIEPIVDHAAVYANAQPNGGPMRFHHICLKVENWEEFRGQVDKQDLPVAMERDLGPGQLSFLYLDGRRAFGHYLEYTCMPDAVWEQIRSM